MRIARPRKPNVPFKRKRRPPPQATKLLTYSMVAGIVFMVLLGIVFLPRMFVDQPPTAIVQLRLNTTSGTRLDVASVSSALELSKFRAVFCGPAARISEACPERGSSQIATLGPGLGGGNATLRFFDGTADGLLDAGDYFEISAAAPGCYRFEIFQDVDRLVGLTLWGGCP